MTARPWQLAAALSLLALCLQAQAQPRGARNPKQRGAARRAEARPEPRSEAPAPEAVAAASPSATRGPTRIDFDDRLIQGQTNRSGSVYLYDRKELPLQSMVKKRLTFREQIVGSNYAR